MDSPNIHKTISDRGELIFANRDKSFDVLMATVRFLTNYFVLYVHSVKGKFCGFHRPFLVR